MKKTLYVVFSLVLAWAVVGCGQPPQEWPSWRGSGQNGVSGQTGLISSWSVEGENLVWRRDFTGRSTPVVMDGRVYVNGRVGEGIDRQAVIAAFDAENGEPIWERRFNIQLSTVPYNRVGWASPTGDPETGYIYVQGVNGTFLCLDRDGEIVWQHSFKEEYGRFEGYGGRTASAVIDEDRVIVNMINGSWGNQGPPRHRYFAFDKLTGDVVWMSQADKMVADRNTQSVPVIAVIGGQRLLIGGAADGLVYALQSRTGKIVWQFQLSKRGINVSPVVEGDVVFIGHSEENVDAGTLGRVIAIDGTGSGDVTATHELWRSDEHRVGFPSPLVHDGRLYVIDNSGNLAALDTETGEEHWRLSIGTVGKASPVWADGKIYVTETNGRFSIVLPGVDSGELLDQVEVTVPGGRYAETYGSPAIAYGRIYFTTEEGVYCLGDKTAAFRSGSGRVPVLSGEGSPGVVASLQVVPGEIVASPGESIDFEVRGFDAKGVALGVMQGEWELRGLEGEVDGGHLTVSPDAGFQAGLVVAMSEGLEAVARARVFPPLPWTEDFDSLEVGSKRGYWIGGGRYAVEEEDGQKILIKPVAASGLLRSNLMIGPGSLSDYTIQADVRAEQKGRRRSDGGLINSGYILDLMGIHQRIQLRSWTAVLRVKEEIDFEIEMGKWYTAKLEVRSDGAEAVVRGKVWPRDEAEPDDWTITATDPHPVRNGAPALQAYSAARFSFDNVQVTGN